MKNKIAFLTIVSGFVLSLGCGLALAENSPTFELLQNSTGIPNYDNTAAQKSAPALNVAGFLPDKAATTTTKAPVIKAAVETSSPTAVAAAPAEPAKPTLMEKIGKDLKDHKTDFAVAGMTGALTGYFLAGCALSGALLGFGIIVVFLLLLRNVS